MKKTILIALYLFSTQVNAQDSSKTVTAKSDTTVFTKVEIESSYPGGDAAWVRYLMKNMHYPDDAVSKNIQGTVIVRFIINIDGTVSDIVAESGPPSGGLREQAILMIKQSGKWIPAMQNGRYVKSYKRQPFQFKLQNM